MPIMIFSVKSVCPNVSLIVTVAVRFSWILFTLSFETVDVIFTGSLG